MQKSHLLFTSIDACLGPRASRFFGSGYKRVAQHLGDITAEGSSSPGALVTARAALTYPRDWSRKSAAGELRPHLSSIDALVLAATLGEVHLVAAHGLTPEQHRRAWLSSVDVRAGSRPHEDLADFRVHARLVSSEPGPAVPPGGERILRSVYDCQVGGLKVRCTFAHERGARTGRGGGAHGYGSAAEVLGPGPARLYGEGYKANEQFADDVAVDLERQRARARLRVLPGPAVRRVSRGAEAAYAPSVTLVDCLVSVAQLAQALLYAQDGLERGSSNTLWMRRMVIEAELPARPCRLPFDAEAYTTRTRLIEFDGGLWRAADIAVDDFCGIRGRSALAHRLPAPQSGPAGPAA